MKKRTRHHEEEEDDDDHPAITATEFAAALNGGEPNAVYLNLKRFARTVKRERRQALRKEGVDDDESSSTDDESEKDYGDELETDNKKAETAQKRLKKDEIWKDDVANYNVPFVGTAVSGRHDDGRVIVGEWPTGLLKAYLQKSPLAIELTGDDLVPGVGQIHKTLLKNKSGKLSQAIYKSYLDVVCEIITGAIPVKRLLREQQAAAGSITSFTTTDNNDPELPRFLSELIKNRLPGLLAILKEENGNNKQIGVVGSRFLTPIVLTILARLSMTSLATCRHIARSFVASVPESVVRAILKPATSNSSKSTNEQKDLNQQNAMVVARIRALELATAMVEYEDPVVFACVGSHGAKDKKIPPGLLYMALKESIHDIGQLDDAKNFGMLCKSVARLLSTCRILVLNGRLPRRGLADVFSRDCIQNVSRLAMFAPLLSEPVTFHSVLSSSDEYGSLSDLHGIGREARRLIFCLVANTSQSPLIHILRNNERNARMVAENVTRALLLLLSAQKGLEIHKFVVHVVQMIPELFLNVFHSLAFPNSKTKEFEYISRLSLVSRLLWMGPGTTKCIGNSVSDTWTRQEQILLTLLPTGLRKQQISKAMQHSNPFLVAETLKFLLRVLQRFDNFIRDEDLSNRSLIIDLLLRNFPDLQTCLALLTRSEASTHKCNTVLVGYTCDVIHALFSLGAQTSGSSTFDWMKALQHESLSHCKPLVVLMQKKFVAFFRDYHVQKGASQPLANGVRFLLEIVMSTPSRVLFSEAYQLVVQTLSCETAPAHLGKECVDDIRYEITCWVDGMTSACLDEFCSLLQTGRSILCSSIEIAKALRKTAKTDPTIRLNVSLLLVEALDYLPQASVSFIQLCCQVASRCLLRHVNPLPLAALIISRGKNAPMGSPGFPGLVNYSQFIAAFDASTADKGLSCLNELVEKMFSSQAFPLKSQLSSLHSGTLDPTYFSRADSETIMRQCIHLALYIGCTCSLGAGSKELFRLILPCSLQLQVDRSVCSVLGTRIADNDSESMAVDILSKTCGSDLVDSKLESQRNAEPAAKSLEFHTSADRTALLLMYVVSSDVQANAVLCHATATLESYLIDPSKPVVYQQFLGRLSMKYLKLYLTRQCYAEKSEAIIKFAEVLIQTWIQAKDAHLCCVIESVLCMFLCEGAPSFYSCALWGPLRRWSPQTIIERCIHTLEQCRVEACTFDDTSLLSALIKTDTVLYGAQFLHVVQSEPTRIIRLSKLLLQNTSFNEAVKQSTIAEMFPGAIGVIRSILSERLISVLVQQDVQYIGDELHSLLSLLKRTSEMVKGRQQWSPKFVSTVHGTLTQLYCDGSFPGKAKNTADKVLLLGIQLCSNPPDVPTTEGDTISRILLICLVRRLSEASTAGQRVDTLLYEGTLALVEACRGFGQCFTESECLQLAQALEGCAKRGITGLDDDSGSQLLTVTGKILLLLEYCPSNDDAVYSSLKRSLFRVLAEQSKLQTILSRHEGGTIVYVLKSSYLVILLLCVSSLEPGDFDEKLAAILMSGFSAGVTLCDVMLRALIMRYTALTAMPLNLIRWNEAPPIDSSQSGWDWLPDAIDPLRIQATIRNFPIDDKYISGDSVNVASGASDDSQSGKMFLDDRRYSAGLLVNLMLTALVETDFNVAIIHRFCDKGCVAITLACLSSRCNLIRQAAVSILGFVLRAMHTEEACSLPSWRDRPQVAMLLKAVHQALTIETISKGLKRGDVPKLPGVSAIFLAKACLILSKPGDKLFPVINRFFLRIEEEHGAFRDLYRLPGFASFLCSSADEPGQAFFERTWVLRLLHDGFLDEDCYRPTASCHALELIVSNIDSFRNCASNDQDTILTLKILAKVVRKAGDRGNTHIFGRLGLLHWMKSILVSRPFPIQMSVNVAVTIAQLLKDSLCCVSRTLSESDLAITAVGLAQPLIDLCILFSSEEHDTLAYQELYTTSVDVLFAILQTWRKQQGNAACGWSVDGICMKSASLFILLLAGNPELEKSALFSICTLPRRPGISGDSLVVFCVRAFAILSSIEDDAVDNSGSQSTLIILTRVLALVTEADVTEIEAALLVKDLFHLRIRCSTENNTRIAYFALFEKLSAQAALIDDVPLLLLTDMLHSFKS